MNTTKPYPRNFTKTVGNFNKITHCRADQNYTIVHLENGEKILMSYTLLRLEEILTKNHNFIRIHRGYLVNKRFIQESNSKEVLLSNGKILPVARRRRG